jgi:hypothetical protein
VSELNVQLLREYFELHRFHVLTDWQHDGPHGRPGDAGLQLFVQNTALPPAQPPPFLLQDETDLGFACAAVEVRAWHADRVYASTVDANPILGNIASEESRARARAIFNDSACVTVLVISELPATREQREKTLQVLAALGIDHVMEFRTVLEGILHKVNAQGHYAPSDTLQLARLLKRYDFIRRQQLDLPFRLEPLPTATPPNVDTVVVEEDAADD